jgi:hypothetical protein
VKTYEKTKTPIKLGITWLEYITDPITRLKIGVNI